MQNLQVELLDLNLIKNASAHRTDRYDLIRATNPIPVLRRGQRFSIFIKFKQRAFDKSIDSVRLIFNFGEFLRSYCIYYSIHTEWSIWVLHVSESRKRTVRDREVNKKNKMFFY